jgi:acetoacetate decarboxylase
MVAHYPVSPIGEVSLAAQYLGCRAGFFIRAFTLQALTDSAVALTALREVWGFPCGLGEIGLGATDATATAQVAAGGITLASVDLADGAPVETGLVRFDPVLNLRAFPSLQEGKRHDLLQMVQIDPDYTVGKALRGRGRVEFPDAGDSLWATLPVRNIISAVYCEMVTELPLARFVMPY